MKKISNAAGRWICVILVLVMTAITCVEPVKAVTGYSSTAWVDNLDFVDSRGSVYLHHGEGWLLSCEQLWLPQ